MSNITQKTIESYISHRKAIVCALLFLVAFNPYFTWQLPISISGIACLGIACFAIVYKKQQQKRNYTFLLILSYLIMALRGGYSFAGAISLMLVCFLFLFDDSFLLSVYKYFVKIFAVICGVSLIVYLLVVILGIPLPHTTISALNQEKANEITYLQYPMLVVADSMYNMLRYRFEAVFDEPGVIGTISGSLLLANRFDLKKWENVVILLAGLCSMSVGFLVMCLVYWIIIAKTKYKVLTIVALVAFIYATWDNVVLSTMLYDRIFLLDGRETFLNREHMDDGWFDHFRKTPEYWTGLGVGANLIYNFGGASYKDLIINHGMLYFILFITANVYPALKLIKNKYSLILFLSILFCVIFQRPFIENIGYLFIIYVPMVVLSHSKEFEANERT